MKRSVPWKPREESISGWSWEPCWNALKDQISGQLTMSIRMHKLRLLVLPKHEGLSAPWSEFGMTVKCGEGGTECRQLIENFVSEGTMRIAAPRSDRKRVVLVW